MAQEVKTRVPIITGVITDSTTQAIERGNAVRDPGVAALQLTPPHYLFRPNDDSMLKHFEALAKGTGMSIIIYNVVPWAYLSPHLLTRIVTTVEGVIGVKQSAGDLKLIADLVLMLRERGRILSAVDTLIYPLFILGAHGAIAAVLTAVPTLLVQSWDAVQAGDHKRALVLHEKILPMWNAISADNLPGAVGPARRRAAGADAGQFAGTDRCDSRGSAEGRTALIRGTNGGGSGFSDSWAASPQAPPSTDPGSQSPILLEWWQPE